VVSIILTVVFFACAAYLGVELSRAVCANITPLDGAPPLGQPPVVVLVAAGALLGALLVTVGAQPMQLGAFAIVVLALAACWSSDSLCGIVPDVFTLVPLGALLVLALTRGNWLTVVSSAIAFAPFALAAWTTHGRGMGWGDAKLVALAGAALGAPLAIFAMIVACVAAVVGYKIKGIKAGPIAFAPYIAAVVGAALPLAVGR
jgi:prepilin signal peptidase PulO-like enzyme (type II secretory pathway)